MRALSVVRAGAACAGLLAAMVVPAAPVLNARQLPTPPEAVGERGLVDRYCVTCHNQRARVGGLALDVLDLSDVTGSATTLERIVRKLRAGLMPPAGRHRPTDKEMDALLTGLEGRLDAAFASHPNPGRHQAFHRLNRAEYRNAVRDLLAVDVDVEALLPVDSGSYGFDNMAATLRVNEALMERYLVAAARISSAAVGTAPPTAVFDQFTLHPEVNQYGRVEGLPFGTRGGALVPYQFPRDGEYGVKVELMCGPSSAYGACDGSGGFEDRHQLEILLDDERVTLFTLEPIPQGAVAGRPWEARFAVKAGRHDVGVTFVQGSSFEEVEGLRQRFLKPRYLGTEGSTGDSVIYQPFVSSITISGPYADQGHGDTPSRRRLFVCSPKAAGEEAVCARKILSTVARRAYRRPVTAQDVDDLLAFYEQGRAEGGFDAGIELAVRRLLVSPAFLFRVEVDPPGDSSHYRVSDLELASRLSFFLWSSIPDDELLELASAGRLSTAAVLGRQVRRMSADPRSDAMNKSFVGQWLQLRNLASKRPSEPLFPDFDETLRDAFTRETELFFESVVREDRSVLDLLTADYTFVNERLARHYGIPNVKGPHFRRVALDPSGPRRGILGHGSILTITSHAARTSPVLRGKWILATLLGTPPPDPPPNIPALPQKPPNAGRTSSPTVREQMAAHRANPVCASCHSMIDPLGFALENFDAVGKWREADEAFNPIDSSGALPDGAAFSGVSEFRDVFVRHPERFVTTVAERLLTYGLGRGLESYDAPVVRKIVRDAARSNYRFSALVDGVVQSVPFQMRGRS